MDGGVLPRRDTRNNQPHPQKPRSQIIALGLAGQKNHSRRRNGVVWPESIVSIHCIEPETVHAKHDTKILEAEPGHLLQMFTTRVTVQVFDDNPFVETSRIGPSRHSINKTVDDSNLRSEEH